MKRRPPCTMPFEAPSGRTVNQITQKLYARPVEFPLPFCHANHGEFSNGGGEETCAEATSRFAAFPAAQARRSMEGLRRRGQTPEGEEKVNRNTSEFKNRCILFKTHGNTNSNRNTTHVSATAPSARFTDRWSRFTGHRSRATNHDSQVTNHGLSNRYKGDNRNRANPMKTKERVQF